MMEAPKTASASATAQAYSQACDNGDGGGCAKLADLYAKGRCVPKDERRAHRLERKAMRLLRPDCDAGDAEACLDLSWTYLGRSKNDVLKYQKRACELGSAWGCERYVDYWKQTGGSDAVGGRVLDRALALYEEACEAGDAIGCEHAAQSLYYASAKARTKAVGLWLKMCDMGLARGCAAAAAAYARGEGVTPNLAETARLRLRACDAGRHPKSCGELATMYYEGTGVAQDRGEAARFWEKGCRPYVIGGCEVADSLSCANLAVLYYEGDGVAQDRLQAARFFERSAKRGSAYGRLGLQVLRETDPAVRKALPSAPQSVDATALGSARAWFPWACGAGSSTGCYLLGLEYERHDEADPRVVPLYERACSAGRPPACFRLAGLYSRGAGVSPDAARAQSLLEQGCEAGGQEACEALTGTLEKAVLENPLKARRSFQAACATGSAEGCVGLGFVFWSGEWVVRDGERAGNPMLRISNDFGGESRKVAVEAGQVPEGRIDDMVLRRLRPGFRLGVFDEPAPPPTQEVSTPERRAKLVDVVTGRSVLLKNEGHILPFGPEVRSVAIIGAQAGDGAVIQQVGSANSLEAYRTPVLPALRERAGDTVTITYAQGDLGLARLPDLPATMLQTPSGEPGLRAEYYANPRRDFSGEPLAVRTEPGVSVMGKPDVPELPGDRQYSVRWSGVFLPSATGVQEFTLEGGGTAALFFDERKVASFEKADIGDIGYANLPMEAGQPVPIRIEWTPREAPMDGGAYAMGSSVGTVLKLGWSAPDRLIEEAAASAAKADVAVVFASHRVGEGMDRLSLALPNDQDALIQAVARANPRTVVVLNTGGPVTMPWLGDVAAVLEMWLPGSVQGPATARLLFGDAEPQGRLPVTFPADETQGPSATPRHYPGTRRADGSLDTAYLEEGVNLGYRYYDVHDQKPLFPFGYGLSYTTFAIEGLGARPRPDGSAVVDVSVRNTGQRAGAEVVQVYLGFPEGTGEPPRLLRGFQKVELASGEQKPVGICLPPRTFEHWDETANGWRVAGGRYQVMVGRSSRDIVYTTDVEIAGRAGGAWRQRISTVELLAASEQTSLVLAGEAEPERVWAQSVSPHLFSVLGVQPQLGRGSTADEHRTGAERVAILGHGLWQRRWGGVPEILGKTFTAESTDGSIGAGSFRVVGILPERFRGPEALDLDTAQVWLPLPLDEQAYLKDRTGYTLRVVGRLRPGVSMDTARREVEAVAERRAAEFPELSRMGDTRLGVGIASLLDRTVGDTRADLLLLLGAAGLLLLISCANAANLLLARASERGREIALRIALGAGRSRITRQLLSESLLLATTGGLAGVAVAYALVRAFRAFAPEGFPRLGDVGVNLAVLVFAVAITTLAGALAGLVPSLLASRVNLVGALGESGTRLTTARGRARLRNGRVLVETALAMVLLVGAGLLIGSYARLGGVDAGFVPDEVLTTQIGLGASYDSAERRASFCRELLERIRAIPGVSSASTIVDLPIGGVSWAPNVRLAGSGSDEVWLSAAHAVGTDYFRTMGIPVQQERPFTSADDATRPGVVIVNQTMARQLWPGRSPLGQAVVLSTAPDAPRLTVVGVAGDTRQWRLSAPAGLGGRGHDGCPLTGLASPISETGAATAISRAFRRS